MANYTQRDLDQMLHLVKGQDVSKEWLDGITSDLTVPLTTDQKVYSSQINIGRDSIAMAIKLMDFEVLTHFCHFAEDNYAFQMDDGLVYYAHRKGSLDGDSDRIITFTVLDGLKETVRFMSRLVLTNHDLCPKGLEVKVNGPAELTEALVKHLVGVYSVKTPTAIIVDQHRRCLGLSRLGKNYGIADAFHCLRVSLLDN